MSDIRRYKMYGFVPRSLSDMQKGIQFGHAVVRYARSYSDTPEYKMWSEFDETFVVLDGGSTNMNPDKYGTLNKIVHTLRDNKLRHQTFYEENIGDQLTAVVMLVDDRVWDREKWPDFVSRSGAGLIDAFFEIDQMKWKEKFSDNKEEAETIAFLRDYLRKFRSA
jgi:predicted FMN-binding regulatory protein PaiB